MKVECCKSLNIVSLMLTICTSLGQFCMDLHVIAHLAFNV